MFCRIFGEGEDQILVTLREFPQSGAPKLTVTWKTSVDADLSTLDMSFAGNEDGCKAARAALVNMTDETVRRACMIVGGKITNENVDPFRED